MVEALLALQPEHYFLLIEGGEVTSPFCVLIACYVIAKFREIRYGCVMTSEELLKKPSVCSFSMLVLVPENEMTQPTWVLRLMNIIHVHSQHWHHRSWEKSSPRTCLQVMYCGTTSKRGSGMMFLPVDIQVTSCSFDTIMKACCRRPRKSSIWHIFHS